MDEGAGKQDNGIESKANIPTTNVNVASAHNVATVGTTAQVAVSNVSIGGNGNLDAFLAGIGAELSVEELELA